LNEIKYRGHQFTIMRNGKPVASLHPLTAESRERTLGELEDLVKRLPHLGEEAEKFEEDVKEMIERQPPQPQEDEWA